jgi:hypothetical protein
MNFEYLKVKLLIWNILNSDQKLFQKEFDCVDLPLNNDVIDEVPVLLSLFAGLINLNNISNFF